MELSSALFPYLKSKLSKWEQTRKNGAYLFSCPNLINHKWESKSPTATFIAGSDRISCLTCGWKGTFFDAVRLLEPTKALKSDSEITVYLMSSFDVDTYSELEEYIKYGWALIPVAKNFKNPIEDGWTSKTHYDKLDWLKWLQNGLNVGLRTGEVSKITVIDLDLKVTPTPELEAIYKELNESETLVQNTPHGLHFVFKYDKDIPQSVKIAGMTVDIRNDGGQIVIQPSKLETLNYHWKNLGAEIKVIPENIKSKLLELLKSPQKEPTSVEDSNVRLVNDDAPLKLKNDDLAGCCNDTFTQLGGAFIKYMSADQAEKTLYLLNKNLLANPMEPKVIKAMMGSLTGYKEGEETTIEQAVYNYLKQQQTITARDAVASLFNNDQTKRGIIDKYLSKFGKEGKAIKLGHGQWQCVEEITWSKGAVPEIDEYKYKIPFFNDIMTFEDGDVLILGAIKNAGKSTISMNIVKEMVNQGLEPYYLYSESGSRFQKLAKLWGLEGKFYFREEINPLKIKLAENAFTIIDWLDFGIIGFEKTGVVLSHLATEMRKKRGILVIFTQLKPENHEWFAPNLVEQYPAFAAKYIQDSDDKSFGHWQLTKVKEPKGSSSPSDISCVFDHQTKIFKLKDLI